jgi:hypothetical protein
MMTLKLKQKQLTRVNSDSIEVFLPRRVYEFVGTASTKALKTYSNWKAASQFERCLGRVWQGKVAISMKTV